MGGEHLITDDETRNIAEGFLSTSPWLGDVTWDRDVIGPGSAYLRDFNGIVQDDAELGEGERWSWTVTFSDPAGTSRSLSHEQVLEGLKRIVYGELPNPELWQALSIRQWFTEPPKERTGLQLSVADRSMICQYALYEKTVFPTGREELFGKKLDLFESQRPDAEALGE
ncbi:hypothetical protein ACFY8C_38980 [Streptomyces flavochromogenes]|uniref:Uncharacterized protein n=1 Tax=Streptomyces flavochromogenes TaxID=68199 RepID=A0ABW6Y3X9_9ACTN|nr:hypothetical protein [Streptomyces flavochromogenes]